MIEHVLDWIGAYHDGELHGDRLRWVEVHLRTCAACQSELVALQNLSVRLQASPPMPARTPPEQFVAQVRLRLPPRGTPVPGRQRLRQAAGLWLPLGVLALWAFGQAVLLVSGLALGVTAVPAATHAPASWAGVPVVLPPLPGLVALPLLVALAQPAGWGGWLALLALNAGLTGAVAMLVWGCLAGWWAARETSLASSGLQAR
jgi:anti-sigma factor RsiW